MFTSVFIKAVGKTLYDPTYMKDFNGGHEMPQYSSDL